MPPFDGSPAPADRLPGGTGEFDPQEVQAVARARTLWVARPETDGGVATPVMTAAELIALATDARVAAAAQDAPRRSAVWRLPTNPPADGPPGHSRGGDEEGRR